MKGKRKRCGKLGPAFGKSSEVLVQSLLDHDVHCECITLILPAEGEKTEGKSRLHRWQF